MWRPGMNIWATRGASVDYPRMTEALAWRLACLDWYRA
jgi:hypothetical protein